MTLSAPRTPDAAITAPSELGGAADAVQGRTWRFTIPLPVMPPSGNARLHWAERARIVKRVRAETALAAASARTRLGAPKADRRRSVRMVLFCPLLEASHPRDPDNLMGTLKPVLDGLVDARWLRGDGPDNVDLGMPRQQASGRGGARWVDVVVEDLP